jgi:3-oxoacyl-[acyl-carrier-protein] synthase II
MESPATAGASRRRVVITGLGIVNPIGSTLDAFWDSLRQGRSGIRPLRSFDVSRLPVRFAGDIPDFDAKPHIETKQRKSLKVMSRGIQMAVVAAQLALNDAKINKDQLDPTRFGVEFGSGLIASELQELAPAALVSGNCQPGMVDLKKWGAEGLATIPPLWMLKYLPNMLTCHVSVLHNAQGPNNTITEGDVAGLLALGEAYHILLRNQADFFLAGAADSRLNALSLVRQCLFNQMSARNDAPDRASRPFDRQRDGLVIGEGGAVLAVEDLGHAERRGATIYAEIVGFGAAFDRDRSGRAWRGPCGPP